MRHNGNMGLRFLTAKVKLFCTCHSTDVSAGWSVTLPEKNTSPLLAHSLSIMKRSNEILRVRSAYLLLYVTVIT